MCTDGALWPIGHKSASFHLSFLFFFFFFFSSFPLFPLADILRLCLIIIINYSERGATVFTCNLAVVDALLAVALPKHQCTCPFTCVSGVHWWWPPMLTTCHYICFIWASSGPKHPPQSAWVPYLPSNGSSGTRLASATKAVSGYKWHLLSPMVAGLIWCTCCVSAECTVGIIPSSQRLMFTQDEYLAFLGWRLSCRHTSPVPSDKLWNEM